MTLSRLHLQQQTPFFWKVWNFCAFQDCSATSPTGLKAGFALVVFSDGKEEYGKKQFNNK